jgi:hypothetical protein
MSAIKHVLNGAFGYIFCHILLVLDRHSITSEPLRDQHFIIEDAQTLRKHVSSRIRVPLMRHSSEHIGAYKIQAGASMNANTASKTVHNRKELSSGHEMLVRFARYNELSQPAEEPQWIRA